MTGSPKNYGHPGRSKLEDCGFKHGQFIRHESEKQFTKSNVYKNPQHTLPPEQAHRFEEEYKPRISNPNKDRIRNSEIYTNRKSKSKIPEMQPGFFRARNSGGKPNPLKETSSTSNSN